PEEPRGSRGGSPDSRPAAVTVRATPASFSVLPARTRVAGRPIEGKCVMKLAVFGANGPTGRLLAELALGEEHDVVAFTRHPDAFPIRHRRLEVVAGDVHDAAAVASAIDGVDAVVSTLGVPFAKTPVTVYSGGVINIMAGM